MPRTDLQGADAENEVSVPMAGNARESVRHAAHNSSTNYGVKGKAKNLGVNEAGNIEEARRYDEQGYGLDGLNIATGRSKSTKFTGSR